MANKYHARRSTWEGMTFDSHREMVRFQELTVLDAAGVISDLRRQVSYDLAVNGIRVCRYIADAVYEQDGVTVVEDTKSPATRTPVYRLKRLLMRACLGIEITEVE